MIVINNDHSRSLYNLDLANFAHFPNLSFVSRFAVDIIIKINMHLHKSFSSKNFLGEKILGQKLTLPKVFSNLFDFRRKMWVLVKFPIVFGGSQNWNSRNE